MNPTLFMRRLIVAGTITATPFAFASSNNFDARTAAMGGAGVASASYGTAPLTNPALLAKSTSQDKVSLISSSVGGSG